MEETINRCITGRTVADKDGNTYTLWNNHQRQWTKSGEPGPDWNEATGSWELKSVSTNIHNSKETQDNA